MDENIARRLRISAAPRSSVCTFGPTEGAARRLRCATRIRFSQVAFVLLVGADGLEPPNLLTAR